VWLVLTAVTGFVVVGKVLSPQYLLWLLPVAVAGLAVADSRALRRWTAGLLLACGLTQVVFPLSYGAITLGEGSPWLAVSALVARNAVMVALLVAAASRCWSGLLGGTSGEDRQRSAGQRAGTPATRARGKGGAHGALR
jgi:hypothetical protein